MAKLTRTERQLHHTSASSIEIKEGMPSLKEGGDGDITLRHIRGKGVYIFAKFRNRWYSRQLLAGKVRNVGVGESALQNPMPSGNSLNQMIGYNDQTGEYTQVDVGDIGFGSPGKLSSVRVGDATLGTTGTGASAKVTITPKGGSAITISDTITDLSDTTITGTPADNEVLAYDSGTSKWINQTASEAVTVTVSDSTANTDFPVVFHDESNALLDDTGAFEYNPSTGLVTATGFSGNLTGALQTASQGNVTTLAGLTSLGAAGAATNIVAGDLTMYNAVNDGNPSIRLGSSATESLGITATYTGSAQTLLSITFDTATSLTSGNEGKYIFNVDGVVIANIDDGGIDLASGKTFAINGTDIVSSPITALNSATQSELVTVGVTTTELDSESNLTFNGSIFAVTGSTTIVQTITTGVSTPITLFVDTNTSGVAAQDSVGLHVDFDRTVAASGTAAHNDIGIDLDVNSASLGTSFVRGMDIDVVGATSGTHTAIGIDLDVDSANTNIGMLINTAGTHIKLQPNADTGDYTTISVADTGDLTIATNDKAATAADIILDADGDIEINADGGDITFKDASTTLVSIDGSGNLTTAGDIELGDASNCTISGSAGDITVEGNAVYRAGGTDVPVADGGTGASTLLTNAILTGNGTSAIQAESALLFSSNNVYPKRSDHDAVGTALAISAGNTTVGTTENIAGGALTLEGGRGKGTGAGGDIVFKTANAGSSGHTPLNDLATALTISDDLSSTFTGVVKVQYDASNYFTTTVAANGATTLATVDALSGEVGHLTLDVDGDIILDADGGNITLQDGGSTYTPSAASDAATKSYVDTTQYTTIIAGMNYNLVGGNIGVIQLSGATRAFSDFTNIGENTTMIAPFDGSLERIYFRCEEDNPDDVIIGFHKISDGTEVPSITPTVAITVDMSSVADDTSTEFTFSSSNTFSKGDILGFSVKPDNDINDAIFTIVLKYDISTY